MPDVKDVKKAPTLPAAANDLFEKWFIDTFHNRGLVGHEFNRIRAAADDLKTRIAAILGKE